MWFKNLFLTKLDKALTLLKSGDKITINCPKGFYLIKDGKRFYDVPVKVEVLSNDVNSKKLWIKILTKLNIDPNVVLEYSSDELKNYLLFNICSKEESVKNKYSKEELEEQLRKAIETDNYESASIINEKLKKL